MSIGREWLAVPDAFLTISLVILRCPVKTVKLYFPLREIEKDPKLRDFQEGRLTPEQWHQHVSRRLGLVLPFQEFCEAWNRTLREPILESDLLARLASDYRLLLLSNTDPIHVACMKERYDFPVFSCPPLLLHACRSSRINP